MWLYIQSLVAVACVLVWPDSNLRPTRHEAGLVTTTSQFGSDTCWFYFDVFRGLICLQSETAILKRIRTLKAKVQTSVLYVTRFEGCKYGNIIKTQQRMEERKKIKGFIVPPLFVR